MSKTLVIYLMAEPETPELARAAVDGGADIVELGIPFSDPLAEGPVIRQASERALARGMRTRACLDVLARTRELVDVPIVPMTYAAILEAYGYERFADDAAAAGASSAIVVDLPVEVHPELRRIQLIAPTSTDERIRVAAAQHRRLAVRRLAHGHDRRARGGLRSGSPRSSSARARWRPPGCRSMPASASRRPSTRVRSPRSRTASSSARARVQVAEEGPDALRDYVASLRAALDSV